MPSNSHARRQEQALASPSDATSASRLEQIVGNLHREIPQGKRKAIFDRLKEDLKTAIFLTSEADCLLQNKWWSRMVNRLAWEESSVQVHSSGFNSATKFVSILEINKVTEGY